jgi:hypothetical protein
MPTQTLINIIQDIALYDRMGSSLEPRGISVGYSDVINIIAKHTGVKREDYEDVREYCERFAKHYGGALVSGNPKP